MIKINKRPLPDGTVIDKEDDYRSGIVFDMLVGDCNNKCYICEDAELTSPRVEHRLPRNVYPALEFNWKNLFLACDHCNSIKRDEYVGIIDPTIVDPEEMIALSLELDDKLREWVVVRKVSGDADIETTISLLDAVYNPVNTSMKRLAGQNLRNKISHELSWFHKKLDEYRENPSEECKVELIRLLSDVSAFASFKRVMVRSVPALHSLLPQATPPTSTKKTPH